MLEMFEHHIFFFIYLNNPQDYTLEERKWWEGWGGGEKEEWAVGV